MISRIAYSMNTFMDQVIDFANGKVDFTNLNQEYKDIDVVVTSGAPNAVTKFKTSLNNKLAGIQCIQAINLESSSTYPTAQPFVTFTLETDNLAKIDHISGIQDGVKYRLRLLLIGS